VRISRSIEENKELLAADFEYVTERKWNQNMDLNTKKIFKISREMYILLKFKR